MYTDEFLKENNIKSINIIAEETFAPEINIKMLDGYEKKIKMGKLETLDVLIKDFLFHYNIIRKRKFKLKKIIKNI